MTTPGGSFSVPGNILLMGEYAVLEEGGLGMALAVERRVRAAFTAGPSLLITATWAGRTIVWTPESPQSSALLSACVRVVEDRLGAERNEPVCWRAGIEIDSSAFFASDGRKSGFGSSAAATVAAIVALLSADGIPADRSISLAPELAIAAHRRIQRGVGSGYDVTASVKGGLGFFRGGASPTWEARAIEWKPTLLSFPGAQAVSTAGSVERYTRWKENNPGAARDFLADSNAAVTAFLSARSAREAAPWFAKSKRLGTALGEAIGVPATIDIPSGLDPQWCKALGAGNEIGVCLVSHPVTDASLGAPLQRIIMAKEGIRWEG